MDTLEKDALKDRIVKNKMTGGIFITIKHLMALRGTSNYNTAQREHQSIRDALAKGNQRKLKLTIKEYCEYVVINQDEVIQTLREKGFTDI
jgi:hypothetical protein